MDTDRGITTASAVAPGATVRVVPREISQRELRNDSGQIMRELDSGESFVITRNGIPVGELVPRRRSYFVGADAAVAAFQGAGSIDYPRLRGDLDAVIDQDARPRV